MAFQKRKCIDLDSTAQTSVNYYSKWLSGMRNKGKLTDDVGDEEEEGDETDEESEEEEEEEDGDD